MLISPNCTTKQSPYPGRRIGTGFTDVHHLELDIQYGCNCSMPQSRTIQLTNIYCSLDYHKYRGRYTTSVNESVRRNECEKKKKVRNRFQFIPLYLRVTKETYLFIHVFHVHHRKKNIHTGAGKGTSILTPCIVNMNRHLKSMSGDQ